MTSIQLVREKGSELAALATDLAASAAGNLCASATLRAEDMPVGEAYWRLCTALAVLRGEKKTVDVLSGMSQRTPGQLVDTMLAAYSFDRKTGVSTFAVPAGVTDEEVIVALNDHFKQRFPEMEWGIVTQLSSERYRQLAEKVSDYYDQRDYAHARHVTLQAVVPGTEGRSRSEQEEILRARGLVFSDPRDLMIAGALHACKHIDLELLKGNRTSVPGIMIYTHKMFGIGITEDGGDRACGAIAAAGSVPSA